MKRSGELMNKKCYLSAIVLIFMMLTIIKVDVSAAAITKTEGNITWSLNDKGVLTISKAATPNSKEITFNEYSDRISSVVIKNGVKEIWEDAFYGFHITDVKIPDSVTSIGNYAFASCDELESIIIPDSVENLGYSAFRYCYKLESVTISGTLLSKLDDLTDIFYETPWLLNKKAPVKGSIGSLNYVLDKSGILTVSGSGKLDTRPYALLPYREMIKKVVVAKESRNICMDLFWFYNRVYENIETVVNNSDSIVYLTTTYEAYNYADDMYNMKPVYDKPDYSWYDKDGALVPIDRIGKGTAIKIRDDTRFTYKISFNGNGATSGSMNEVTGELGQKFYIPRNRFERKGYSFTGFTYKIGDKTLTADSGEAIVLKTTDVRTKDFLKGKTLKLTATWKKDTSVFPEGTNLVDKNGKKTGYVVTSAVKGNLTAKYVGTGADKKKTSVTIKDTIKDVNGNTYKVTEIGAKALKGSKTVKKVKAGKNVISIGDEAFSGCVLLTEAVLDTNLKTIGDKAFYKTAIKSLTLPANTTYLGAQFIAGDSKLKTLIIKSSGITVKTLGDNAFGGFGKSVVIKVPKKMKAKYTTLFLDEGLNNKVKIQIG